MQRRGQCRSARASKIEFDDITAHLLKQQGQLALKRVAKQLSWDHLSYTLPNCRLNTLAEPVSARALVIQASCRSGDGVHHARSRGATLVEHRLSEHSTGGLAVT